MESGDNKCVFVYSWGKNKEGELGLGHQHNVSVPKSVKKVSEIEVSWVSSSGHHSGMVSSGGEVYLCGSGLHGKLGVETMNPNVLRLTRLQLERETVVRGVACGDYHTLCLLEDGSVLSWGGTLHKKTGQFTRTPGLVSGLASHFVVQVQCGDFHSAVLTQQGLLFTWGGGGAHFNKGQLGLDHLHDQEKPA